MYTSIGVYFLPVFHGYIDKPSTDSTGFLYFRVKTLSPAFVCIYLEVPELAITTDNLYLLHDCPSNLPTILYSHI
jgi:hypothetical protein